MARKRPRPGGDYDERTQSAPSSDEFKVGQPGGLRPSESLPLISPGESKARETAGRQRRHVEEGRAPTHAFGHEDFHASFGPGALGLTFGWTPGLGLTVVELVAAAAAEAEAEAAEAAVQKKEGANRISELSAVSGLKPQPRDVLITVNGTPVGADAMDFASVVSLMKEEGDRDRDLVFRRFDDAGAAAAKAASQINQGTRRDGNADGVQEKESAPMVGAETKVTMDTKEVGTRDGEQEKKSSEKRNSKYKKIGSKKQKRDSESKAAGGSRTGSPKGKRRRAKRVQSIVNPMAMLQQGLQQMHKNTEAATVRPKKVKVNPFIGEMCRQTKRVLELADSLQTLHVSVT